MSKINTKKLCVISMLLAITVVLSYISGYLRIGTGIKLSVNFISVYLAAALYGPLAGAFVGAMADVISCLANPVGALVWQLTVIELMYGAFYGVIFYRKKETAKGIYIKALVCSAIRFMVDLFLKTKILSDAGYVPEDYVYSLCFRLPGCIAMFFLTTVAFIIMERKYTNKFRDMIS